MLSVVIKPAWLTRANQNQKMKLLVAFLASAFAEEPLQRSRRQVITAMISKFDTLALRKFLWSDKKYNLLCFVLNFLTFDCHYTRTTTWFKSFPLLYRYCYSFKRSNIWYYFIKAENPAQCRALCDEDFEFGLIDSKEECYKSCGVTHVSEEIEDLGACQNYEYDAFQLCCPENLDVDHYWPMVRPDARGQRPIAPDEMCPTGCYVAKQVFLHE